MSHVAVFDRKGDIEIREPWFGNWAEGKIKYAHITSCANLKKTGFGTYKATDVQLGPLYDIWLHLRWELVYHFHNPPCALRELPLSLFTPEACQTIPPNLLPRACLTSALLLAGVQNETVASLIAPWVPENLVTQEIANLFFEKDWMSLKKIPLAFRTPKMISEFEEQWAAHSHACP